MFSNPISRHSLVDMSFNWVFANATISRHSLVDMSFNWVFSNPIRHSLVVMSFNWVFSNPSIGGHEFQLGVLKSY